LEIDRGPSESGSVEYPGVAQESPADQGRVEAVLGTVTQPRPGVLNDILDETQLDSDSYTLVADVENGTIMSALLIEDLGQGEFASYALDNDQLNSLVDSEYLERIVALEQDADGSVSLDTGSRAAAARAEFANENVGNRYAGPIVAVDDDRFLQQVGDDVVAHRGELFENVSVDSEQPVEISYEFDGASVRTLEPENELGLER
jgi:hypothetical protein